MDRTVDAPQIASTYLDESPRLRGGPDGGTEAYVFLPQHITPTLAIYLCLRDAPPVDNLHTPCLVQYLSQHLRRLQNQNINRLIVTMSL